MEETSPVHPWIAMTDFRGEPDVEKVFKITY